MLVFIEVKISKLKSVNNVDYKIITYLEKAKYKVYVKSPKSEISEIER